MSDNAYNEVPYPTRALSGMHPDRLASVATLFGMTPAPVAACRVLEIGCGSGGNLIPMAYRLRDSHFTGIDLADVAIAEGRRVGEELALTNLDLRAMDLREIGPALGQFDYILAHGLFSWIPDHLRDPLLAVCRERLAPQGVAFISYNTFPGRHVRAMLREMMLYRTRDLTDPRERIDRARELLRMVSEAGLVSGPWLPMIQEEIRQSLTGADGWFYHDDLAPVNDAFFVRDFIARAAHHSLQYLGDAQQHMMFDTRISLDWVGGDVTEREQYFDFLCLRPFRQTLLCRDEVQLDRPPRPELMDRFLFSSSTRETNGKIEGLSSVCLANAPETVQNVARAMGAVYPQPVAFDAFLALAPDRETLRDILFALISSGFATFHTHGFAAGSAGPRPKVNTLARWESEHMGVLTYSNHTANQLDAMVRTLVQLLDGTRDFESLASALAQVDGAPAMEDIRKQLPQVIAHMSHAGLLEEQPFEDRA